LPGVLLGFADALPPAFEAAFFPPFTSFFPSFAGVFPPGFFFPLASPSFFLPPPQHPVSEMAVIARNSSALNIHRLGRNHSISVDRNKTYLILFGESSEDCFQDVQG